MTTALALARAGFRAVICEQAGRLEQAGAGIQLSPNATHILAGLGLADRVVARGIAPEALRVRTARGRQIVRMPLGQTAASRYGAPYLVVHRADLQSVLLEEVRAHPDVLLKLGARVEAFAVHANGVTAECKTGAGSADEHGIALVAADGLWSTLRSQLGDLRPPRFAERTAWRATVPAADLAAELREPVVSLWLGRHAHLVHYPVSAGSTVNIVAIVRDHWRETGWSAAGAREEIAARFARWAPAARKLIAAPGQWQKWALYDRPPLRVWGDGPVTLLGDAAHPMLPFLAQGAASAVEDAHVLAQCLRAQPDEPAQAFRRYEGLRRRRTRRLQREAARNRFIYAQWGVGGFLRNTGLRLMGGKGLLRRYDWIYDWRCDLPFPPASD